MYFLCINCSYTLLAIKSYEEQKLDSTGVTVNLLLNITNLFLDLMRIVGEMSKAFNNDDQFLYKMNTKKFIALN